MSVEEGKPGKLPKLLLQLKDLPINVLKAAIGAIPEYQRDELLSVIMMEYKEELTETLNSIVVKNNITAKISNINIKPE